MDHLAHGEFAQQRIRIGVVVSPGLEVADLVLDRDADGQQVDRRCLLGSIFTWRVGRVRVRVGLAAGDEQVEFVLGV